MKSSYQVLKEVIDAVGVKQAAAELGVSHSLVYKWCEDSAEKDYADQPSGAANPLDRIKKLYELTKKPEIIHWICEMGGGYFVQNPITNQDLVSDHFCGNTQKLIQEFSDILQSITTAFNNDRAIARDEAETIRKEWEDVKRIGECFVAACESGKFDSLNKPL